MKPIRSALIVGGGRVGARLARQMEEEGIMTRLIEADKARCLELAEQMDKTVVLHGDGSDQKLFLEENLNQIDAVISVTDDDETNVLVSLLAKNLGVENTVTRIGKSSYYPFLTTIGIEKWSVPDYRPSAPSFRKSGREKCCPIYRSSASAGNSSRPWPWKRQTSPTGL